MVCRRYHEGCERDKYSSRGKKNRRVFFFSLNHERYYSDLTVKLFRACGHVFSIETGADPFFFRGTARVIRKFVLAVTKEKRERRIENRKRIGQTG